MDKAVEEKKMADLWKESAVEVNRPSWNEYFMTMAMLAATRSIDAQWQAGAVLVKDKKIIGTGYNSFPRGMPDWKLPNVRPLKYDWVIHSEVNAIYNCIEDPSGSTCYTNGHPCLECMKALYQCGVKDYIITKGKATMIDNYSEEQLAIYNSLISLGNIKITEMKLSGDAFRKLAEIMLKS